MTSNRFEKAMLNGNQKENVTDIKTAGIIKTAATPIITDIRQSVPLTSECDSAADVGIPDTENVKVSDRAKTHITEKISDKAADIDLPAPQIQESALHPAVHQATLPATPPKYPEHASADSTKNGRNNIPNMFTRKNESKSIRKSLVLRPSSVKTAENYCAKNGGSFNELIQILLDNFIDEYGL